MKRDYRDYLDDIVNAIEEVEIFTAGMSFEDFSKDKKTINAVVRSFEVIGEAAKIIPNNMKKKHVDIPWKKMAGMRDKLIHEYFGVDLEIIWTVIKADLPPIKPLVKKIAAEMQ